MAKNRKARSENPRRKEEDFLGTIRILTPLFQKNMLEISLIHELNKHLAGIVFSDIPKEHRQVYASKKIPAVLHPRTRKLCTAIAKAAHILSEDSLLKLRQHLISFVEKNMIRTTQQVPFQRTPPRHIRRRK